MPHSSNTPDLIFVHGAHVGAWVWEEHFIPFFEAGGHRCSAVELRDASDNDHSGREGLSHYAVRLGEALASAPTPPVVVAHSMGAAVSLRTLTSTRSAESLANAAGLVMLAPVPPFGLAAAMPWLSTAEPLMWSLVAALEAVGNGMPPVGVLENALFASDLSAEQRHGYLARARPESRRALSELMTPFLTGWPLPPFAAQFGSPFGATAPFGAATGWGVGAGSVPECPMAVVGGGGDRLFGPALVKTSAAWLNAPCEIVPRMGHLLMLESDWERAAVATARAVAVTTAAGRAAA